jgi:hypothetical protein
MRSALAACAWQIRVMASGYAALLYASAQGKYDCVRFRMRQVEASAKSTTKLVMQRHSNVPRTQPHSHAPQRQSLCANRLRLVLDAAQSGRQRKYSVIQLSAISHQPSGT